MEGESYVKDKQQDGADEILGAGISYDAARIDLLIH